MADYCFSYDLPASSLEASDVVKETDDFLVLFYDSKITWSLM